MNTIRALFIHGHKKATDILAGQADKGNENILNNLFSASIATPLNLLNGCQAGLPLVDTDHYARERNAGDI